jgi:hypothetical protein
LEKVELKAPRSMTIVVQRLRLPTVGHLKIATIKPSHIYLLASPKLAWKPSHFPLMASWRLKNYGGKPAEAAYPRQNRGSELAQPRLEMSAAYVMTLWLGSI